ncbi:hypothetical protein OKW23_000710 [Bacilli bacterium PM5-9]|nr:hypothetical protein [Bacilli bacterium PM5-9]
MYSYIKKDVGQFIIYSVYNKNLFNRQPTDNKTKGKPKKAFDEMSLSEKADSVERRKKALIKRSEELKELILFNLSIKPDKSNSHKFITLTFDTDVFDLKVANKEFRNFIKRLNYYLDTTIDYITVSETQCKSKRIHFHTILFNCPYIDSNKLSDIWKNGFVKINKINKSKNGFLGASNYLSKYLLKEFDIERRHSKTYLKSKNLKEPPIEKGYIYDGRILKDIKQSDDVIFKKHFSYEMNGFNFKKDYIILRK